MRLIWATRGRTWGFRFLLTADLIDPLLDYETVFSGLPNSPRAWRRVGDRVALRFPDPEGRADAAGRVIPHEFVVIGPESDSVTSVDDGLRTVWPEVQEWYGRLWNQTDPAVVKR